MDARDLGRVVGFGRVCPFRCRHFSLGGPRFSFGERYSFRDCSTNLPSHACPFGCLLEDGRAAAMEMGKVVFKVSCRFFTRELS